MKEGPWVPLITSLLGADTKCLMSVVYSLPRAPNQSWHADGGHIRPPADIHNRNPAPAYAICVFVPLINLTQSVGFTQFWPGSHLSDGLIGFGAAAEMLKVTVDGIVEAGGCVLYDYRLMHRGMANSSDVVRPVLQLVYHIPSYSEVKNYGKEYLLVDQLPQPES
jgi:ectoine hydroxylase-related dioxygenase (phytanoyl-CoA dioxygenase family)